MANPTTLYTLNDGRLAVNVTENKTLAITDQGVVQNVITDGVVVTLPATVVGYNYTVRNGGDAPSGAPTGAGSDGSALVSVIPNASDLIAGMQLTASDADSIDNTKATSKVGDEISLVGNGTTGWNITNMRGTWAQIAI
jgi:hypothetical protein